MRKILKANSLILFIAFSSCFFGSAIWFLIPLYLKDVGINETQIGFISALTVLISFLISIPIGLSNDRFHSRFFISIGLLLCAVMYFFLGYATTFYVLLMLFILNSIGINFSNLSLDSYVLKLKDNILKLYLGGLGIFSGLSKIIIGLMFTFITLVTSFKIIAIGYFFISLISLKLPKNETFSFELGEYKKDLINKKSVIFIVIMFLFFLHFGPENVNYSLFLKDVFNLNITEMSIYMGIPVIILGFSSYYFGDKLSNGYLSYKVLLWGLFLNGIGHIIQVVPILLISFSGRIIHEIGDGAVFMFMFNGINMLFPKQRIGGNMGILTIFEIIATIISSVFSGIIAENYSNSIPFVISGIACLLALIIAFKYRETLTH